ncbi:hypothetical protein KJZ67_04115 [Patescibacteria group bacterium]|nr:hypothetical protein [Patescibacteria group bacterium]
MANSGSVLQQIGESFEDIGKDIARETVQAPKDIVGTALESLGVSSGQKKNPKQAAADPQSGQENAPAAPGPSDEVKRAIARAALRELSGQSQPKELSVWEKIQKEEEQKKEMEKKQKEQARKQALPQPASKRPRGDLYGKKAKQTSMENKSKRQD